MAENMKKNIPENMPPMPDKPKKEKKGEPTADELRDMMKKNGSKGPGGPGGPRAMIREKPKNIRATLGKLLKYIGKNKYSVILIIVTTIITTLLNLLGPTLQGKAIDAITITEQRLSVDFDGLVRILVLMAVVYLASTVIQIAQGIASAKISQDTVYNMRKDLFRKISYLPISYVDTHAHGDIMSRMTNDVDNISQTLSSSITSLISAVLTLIGAFAMLVKYDWRMALVSLITIPLTVVVSMVLSKLMRKYFIARQVLLGQLNTQVEEMVTGYKTVMAYGKEADACRDFAEISEEFRKCSIKANVWGGIMGPAMNIINNLNYLIVAAFGAYFTVTGAISVGDVQAILQYSRQLSQPINQISNQYANILTAIAGAERVFNILDTPDEVDEGKTELDIPNMSGNVDFSHINFSYVKGKQVIKDFNLEVKQGQKIALVGATGSGKTTIVNLLTRFYDIDSGKITIDGVDINDIPKKELRSAIAIVLQDTVLFHDTIGNNIKYGRLDATDDEVKAAAETAEAREFIERLPEGYNTVLSEGGSNLSQGQRQLLSIARAVLADPKILILDEATSSVDTRTEMHIQQAMVALMKNRTSLIIAHRLSTIRDSDMIIVMKDGQVMESGNHDQLLEKKGVYYGLYQNQFAGIET
ncbi:MAG: ABC transporter ATP-binding protein [Eubacteriales bacterium]|nr:ABC transporter ATP-binding protein [Eubacteriales bacterium]